MQKALDSTCLESALYNMMLYNTIIFLLENYYAPNKILQREALQEIKRNMRVLRVRLFKSGLKLSSLW